MLQEIVVEQVKVLKKNHVRHFLFSLFRRPVPACIIALMHAGTGLRFRLDYEGRTIESIFFEF